MTTNVKASAAVASIVSNSVLILIKLVVGMVMGSVSIIAEAIHSGVDLVAAIIAFFAVRVADQPPDDSHNFGHGKIENVSGTVEALLIIAAAVFIGYEAVKKMLEHAQVEHAGIGVVVMLISAVANWIVSKRLFKVAKETDSIALEADGHHLRLDVYTCAGILAGLTVVYFTGLSVIDQMLGLAVAVWIGWIGIQISAKAVGPLLDTQLPGHEVESIASILHSDERILHFHKLRTRKSGAHRHVDVHIVMRNGLSLDESHSIAEEIEDRIRALFRNVSVLTHVEPEDESKAEV